MVTCIACGNHTYHADRACTPECFCLRHRAEFGIPEPGFPSAGETARHLEDLDDPFVVGDIVSRDGTDEHEVIEDDDEMCMRVRCTKRPSSGWTEVGDEEFNLRRRYSLVRRPAPNGAVSRTSPDGSVTVTVPCDEAGGELP